jgi:hypothetical protein
VCGGVVVAAAMKVPPTTYDEGVVVVAHEPHSGHTSDAFRPPELWDRQKLALLPKFQ